MYIYQKGCAGAVWKDGTPSEHYCKGAPNGAYTGTYPWWARCCYWQPIEKRCLPKISGNFSIKRKGDCRVYIYLVLISFPEKLC